VRHAYYVEDTEAGLRLGFGATAIVEVLFIGVEVLGGSVGDKMAGVRREVKVLAKEGVVGRSEIGALSGGKGFGKKGGLEQRSDVGQGKIISGSELVGEVDDAGTDFIGAAGENGP
jgi:hypothetical protein